MTRLRATTTLPPSNARNTTSTGGLTSLRSVNGKNICSGPSSRRRTYIPPVSSSGLTGTSLRIQSSKNTSVSSQILSLCAPWTSRLSHVEQPWRTVDLLQLNDARAWVDGDLVRLLILWNHGGMWIDMDTLLTRDLSPLLEHEFVTQWDCYDKIYQALNGALMRFRQHSPYLCEAFHLMSTSSPPRSPSTDWGAILYLRLWRRLLAESIPPFRILPFCFSDPLACRLDNSVPDPFKPDRSDGQWTNGYGLEENGGLDQVLKRIFAVHLHNRWDRPFPQNGWVERLLLRRYDQRLKEIGIRDLEH
ncbi:hypothetical protein F5141DRAFT_655108 [Pisolithus sp. B1]|nr:hypothetical protein F5141DRAFT_655108 [Pisolithus sp. B1]